MVLLAYLCIFCSRRQWDGMIKAWKKSIHKYDQPKDRDSRDNAASNSHSSGAENRLERESLKLERERLRFLLNSCHLHYQVRVRAEH